MAYQTSFLPSRKTTYFLLMIAAMFLMVILATLVRKPSTTWTPQPVAKDKTKCPDTAVSTPITWTPQPVATDKTKCPDADVSTCNNNKLKEYAIKVAKGLKTARMHARGVKTSDALNEVIDYMSDLLKFLNTSFADVTKRNVMESKHICPEKIHNLSTGYPLYDIGYIVQPCTYAKPLHTLATVAVAYVNTDFTGLVKLLHGILDYNPKINIIVGTYIKDINVTPITSAFKNIKFRFFEKEILLGAMWNNLVQEVLTEYVLIARDVTSFNYDARIDRMIREIESLSVKVVGGSTRDISNKWRLGCQQRAFRNFTISYIEGYDESIHDCVFCDLVEGPFLIRTQDFKAVKFDPETPEMGLFEDFFMRIGGEQIICPDAMFYTNIKERSRDANAWEMFGRKRSLYKIKYSTGITITFKCIPDKYPCNKVSGKMLSPCCMHEHAVMNNLVMEVCKKNNIICQIECGNLVGAVKFYNVLPRERDGDIQFYQGNFSAINKTRLQFTGLGYDFYQEQFPSSCPEEKVHGLYEIFTSNWRIDWVGFCLLDSKLLKEKGLNVTLIANAVQYVVGPRNPALAARNRYPWFFRHSEHYLTLGLNSSILYTEHKWNKCLNNSHDCLSHYNNDGNIQFFDVIP